MSLLHSFGAKKIFEPYFAVFFLTERKIRFTADGCRQIWLDTKGSGAINAENHAGMVELVNAVDSKSTGFTALGVRVSLPVPEEY